jgi:5,10-methylenetetrahydromethanopterin reductase
MVEIWSAGGPVAGQARSRARRAEEDGFDGLSFGDTQCMSADPFVGLTAAAGVTSRIRLGVGVTNPLTRHPAVAACAIASLQLESGGRAVLGVGRGDSAVSRLGLKVATVGQLRDFLVQLQGYLAGEPMDVDRPESRLQWLSSQALPKVPVDVAATGPAVIEVGAQLAERVTFNVGADEKRLRWAIARAREARRDHGGSQESLSLGAYLSVAPHPDPRVAQRLAKGVVAAYAHFSAMPGHPSDLLDPGDADVYKALGERYEGSRHARSDASHTSLLPGEFIERFAVAGPPEHCIEKLTRLVKLGLHRLAIVGPAADAPPEEVATSRRLLADVVLPGVREGARYAG